MKINQSLNLVVPVDSAEGEIYFHSMPLHREVFQKYHFVICTTFTRLLVNGMEMTGAKVAAMTLEEVAKEQGKWEGKDGVQNGLMAEIARITNVLCLTETGWESLDVETAVSRGYVEEEDWQDAKQRIVFFILICAMTRLQVRNDLLMILNESWQTQTTSSTCTEFAASLPISTGIEPSSKAAKPSLHPH